MRILVSCALLCAAVLADDAVIITAEQRAKFWRAQAEYLAAKAKLESAQAELARTCGSRQVIAGSDGEPTCAPKPEQPKKQAP